MEGDSSKSETLSAYKEIPHKLYQSYNSQKQ